MNKEHAYATALALPTNDARCREAAELLREQADKLERVERELALLRPHPGCDIGCVTACAGEAKDKLDRYEGLLLWALYHHQGGSSPVGQPIRRALDMGAHDELTPEQVTAATAAAGRPNPHDPTTPEAATYRRQQVTIDYTNWKGERALRRIQPRALRWGQTPYHPEPQFLLRAWDLEKGAMREFALKDIHTWAPPENVANDSAAATPQTAKHA